MGLLAGASGSVILTFFSVVLAPISIGLTLFLDFMMDLIVNNGGMVTIPAAASRTIYRLVIFIVFPPGIK